MRGYKAFDKDLKCRGKQYAVGGEYEENGKPVICVHGMRFCERLDDAFDYYPFDETKTRVCEVVALGDIARETDDSSKCCTNRFKIIRELDWEEIYEQLNTGTGNTGRNNSGWYNTGDGNSGRENNGNQNSGSYNDGNWNSGNQNSGNYNSGNHNSGNQNSGIRNSGWLNTGDENSGYRNSGDNNSGWYNSGNGNSGFDNTGSHNSGSHNSGSHNSGSHNSGAKNSGNRNSGNHNRGMGNSGDWNIADFSSGVFCTETPECLIFDKPSGMTLEEWRESDAHHLLEKIPIDANVWIYGIDMTDKEKANHLRWKTTGGYLREGTYEGDFIGWWASLDADEKATIFGIPNFDPDKFEIITGLHLHDEMPRAAEEESTGEAEAPETTGLGHALAELFKGRTEEEIMRAFEEVTGKAVR